MTYELLQRLAREAGFSETAPLAIATISLKQEVRDMCAGNTCGQYGKRWSCPPGCGSLEQCRRLLEGHTQGILVQTVGDIEDGFDFEAMVEIEAAHKAHFYAMYARLRELSADVLAIGAGCCTQCRTCTYPDAACRFPEKQTVSMEAFGMVVSEICRDNGMKYYYGPRKMAYTSCFLV